MFSFDAPLFSPVGLDGPARLVNVHDGDTVSVVSRLANDDVSKEYLFHIRLLGIDTCELRSRDPILSRFAHRTRQRVIEILNPRGVNIEKEEVLVHVEITALDKYASRFVGNIWSNDGENVSETLLREKYAKEYSGKTKKIIWTVDDVF